LLFAVIGGGNTGSLADCIDPHIVIRGLDPRIHADLRRVEKPGESMQRPVSMDCRVKPGNDEIPFD
jgi:hypothetical protein